MELLSHTANYKGLFPDKRLEKRASMIAQSLLLSKTASIHGATRHEAEQKGFYRFLDNELTTIGPFVHEATEGVVLALINGSVTVNVIFVSGQNSFVISGDMV